MLHMFMSWCISNSAETALRDQRLLHVILKPGLRAGIVHQLSLLLVCDIHDSRHVGAMAGQSAAVLSAGNTP